MALHDSHLDPIIVRWLSQKGWKDLRPIQHEACKVIFNSDKDMIVSAGTASGKSEAAVLPALSSILKIPSHSLGIIVIGPLKSLINDQYNRFESLFRDASLPITRWHADAPPDSKRGLVKKPSGLCLITPESIEALLINRPDDARRLFHDTKFIIVDELHSFLVGERGTHVASLMERIDALAQGQKPRRIGLSATLGDLRPAAFWLNAHHPDQVAFVQAPPTGSEIDITLSCMMMQPIPPGLDEVTAFDMGYVSPTVLAASRILQKYVKDKNLIFGGSRRVIETLLHILRSRQSETEMSFFPHHGSLSKEVRDEAEEALKEGLSPVTVIATSTLEMGIDIGEVQMVGQIGAPRSIAALKQRVGRSGRRAGSKPKLDLMIFEALTKDSPDPCRPFHFDLVCSIAALDLLQEGFVEPSPEDAANLSVTVHQILCICASETIMPVPKLIKILKGAAPFARIGEKTLRALIDKLCTPEVNYLIPSLVDDAVALSASAKERLKSPDAYAVFATPIELTLIHDRTPIGRIPISLSMPPNVGSSILFAGERWAIVEIDLKNRKAIVEKSTRGTVPIFDGGEPSGLHPVLVQRIKYILEGGTTKTNLDYVSKTLLNEARKAYKSFKLDQYMSFNDGKKTIFLPWLGTNQIEALCVALKANGLQCSFSWLSLTVDENDPLYIKKALNTIAAGDSNISSWLQHVALPPGKFDAMIDDQFRVMWWAGVKKIGMSAQRAAQVILKGR